MRNEMNNKVNNKRSYLGITQKRTLMENQKLSAVLRELQLPDKKHLQAKLHELYAEMEAIK